MRGEASRDQAVPILPYLAIATTEVIGAAAAMTLSPRVMHWSPSVWLIDLRPTRDYWTMQAQRRGIKVAALLQMVWAEALGHGTQTESLVFASCPWQALLLNAHLNERSLSGPLELREPFSQALLRQLSWPVWFAVARDYAAALTQSKSCRFDEQRFHSDLNHLERAVVRLGQQHPAQMVDAKHQAFRRRFGEHIARLWQWTFAGVAEGVHTAATKQAAFAFAEEEVFASGFPWVQAVVTTRPGVVRQLEYPVWSWDQLVADFTTDLDLLADLPALASGAAVLRLEWILHLEDLSDCLVNIRFRHPHSLRAERGEQKTVLIQACHSFEAVYLQRSKDASWIAPAPLIGWSLVAASCLARPSTAISLFGEVGAAGEDMAAAMRIDNRLQIALERYQVTSDWVAEGAFTKAGAGAKDSDVAGAATEPAAKPWAALAARRPLYIYAEPRVLGGHETPTKAAFIERTGEVWWQKPEGTSLERNYFVIEHRSGQRSWATRGEAGEWWVHGLFA